MFVFSEPEHRVYISFLHFIDVLCGPLIVLHGWADIVNNTIDKYHTFAPSSHSNIVSNECINKGKLLYCLKTKVVQLKA